MRLLSSVLILVFLVFVDHAFGGTEKTGSSAIKEKLQGHLKSGVDKIQELKSKVIESTKKPEIHHHTIWEKVANTIVNELKSNLPTEVCLPGLIAEKTKINQMVKLTKGKLFGLNKVIYKNDARLTQEGKHTAEVEVQLTFKNLRMEYYYEYEGTSLYVKHAKREGELYLQMDGETKFTVIGFARKTEVKGNDCYLTIKNAAITGTGKMRTVRVARGGALARPFYFIIKYFSHTVKGVTAVVSAVQEEIKSYVSDAVLDMMETAVKKQDGVCGANQKVMKRNCSAMKSMKNYDP